MALKGFWLNWNHYGTTNILENGENAELVYMGLRKETSRMKIYSNCNCAWCIDAKCNQKHCRELRFIYPILFILCVLCIVLHGAGYSVQLHTVH